MNQETLALPGSGEVAALLGGLLGREVAVAEGRAPDPPALAAVYRTDAGDLRAVLTLDAAAACHCGAALTLIPAAGAQEAARAGQVPENMRENLREVLNVAAQLLNATGSIHSKLDRVVPVAELDEQERSLLASPVRHHDYDVDVNGYGAGRISLRGA